MIVDSAKSGIKFRTSKLNVLNSDYQSLLDGYYTQQEAVLSEILDIAATFAKTLLAVDREEN